MISFNIDIRKPAGPASTLRALQPSVETRRPVGGSGDFDRRYRGANPSEGLQESGSKVCPTGGVAATCFVPVGGAVELPPTKPRCPSFLPDSLRPTNGDSGGKWRWSGHGTRKNFSKARGKISVHIGRLMLEPRLKQAHVEGAEAWKVGRIRG